jgi:hypothetical protein
MWLTKFVKHFVNNTVVLINLALIPSSAVPKDGFPHARIISAT